MPGPDPRLQKEEARRWLGHGERDAVAAKRAIDIPPPLADIAADHCQQAAQSRAGCVGGQATQDP